MNMHVKLLCLCLGVCTLCALEWSEPLLLTGRGFLSGCGTVMLRNYYDVNLLACTTGAHIVCDQLCGLEPDPLQLMLHEMPAYCLGACVGMQLRQLVPHSWRLCIQQHLPCFVAQFCGLNEHESVS